MTFCGSASNFGSGDLYCSLRNFLALAGLSAENWAPQYNYWLPLEALDNGGENVLA